VANRVTQFVPSAETDTLATSLGATFSQRLNSMPTWTASLQSIGGEVALLLISDS